MSSLFRATVIDSLQKTFTASETAVVFLFCHKDREKDPSSINFLENILAQLIYRKRQFSYSTNSLFQLESSMNTKASSKSYQNAIHAEINRYSRVFFIVDGLDTIAEKERILNRLMKFPDHVRFLITLREVKKTEEAEIIQATARPHDIEQYVQIRIRQDAALARLAEEDSTSPYKFRDHIVHSVVEKSHGM
jgi:hypothetical protein